MKASEFDPQRSPTLSVEEGYTIWAASYDENLGRNRMDYPLLERVQTAPWERIEAAADLACGTGRVGAWLKARGVRDLDGVDLTEAMLKQSRAKGIYRRLYLADLRQTPLNEHAYDLVIVSLADEHLPEVAPLYKEAARLARSQGYLALVGYHPFFQLSGVPTTFEPSPGVRATIEGYIHLFSEHVEAANAHGWLLREMYERTIDDTWVAQRPQAARHKGWPVSYLFLWQRQP